MERTGDAMKLRVLYDLRALRLCNPPALQLYLYDIVARHQQKKSSRFSVLI